MGNFWKENIFAENTIENVMLQLHTRLDEMTNEIAKCQLNEERKEVAVSIAGYVAKTLSSQSDCNQCEEKLIFNNKDNGQEHGKYPRLLSRGGLTIPSLVFTGFIFQTFSILYYISPTKQEMKKKTKKNIRKFAENVLPKHLNKVVNFACVNHEKWAVRFSVRTCINIFHDNEQKIANQSVRKDQIKDFKRDKQRMTKAHLYA